MITILAFVVAIVLLVVFHEYGHYWVARRCGVKVLRFSVGFGRVLYSKRFAGGDTEWVISAIPLGGYVKMVDEREDDVSPEDLPYAFNRKPVLQRIAIVAAGPLANFLLAIVLYWGLFIHGVPGLKPKLGEVPPETPAAVAMMQPGETILRINGETIPTWQELHWKLLDLSLKHDEVRIDGLQADGQKRTHVLDMSSMSARDLDAEFLNKLGLHLYRPVILPVIGTVVAGSAAEQAGLQAGDLILRVDGIEMKRWMEVVEVIRAHSGMSIRLDIQRGDTNLTISVIPQPVEEGGKKIGKIGAGPKVDEAAFKDMYTEVSYGSFEAIRLSLRKTWETSEISLKMMGKMVIGEVSVKNLSGPITIADYAGQSAKVGMVAYLSFLALISISLGVLNLLPVPLLDGGHLLYYAAEIIKGGPLPDLAWEIGQKIGIALLGTLMVFAIYNDISRLV